MNAGGFRIFPLGDSALTVEFGDEMSNELNEAALQLAELLDTDRFPGYIEAAPAYSSTAVFYDPSVVRGAYPHQTTAFEAAREQAASAAAKIRPGSLRERRTIRIPVNFNGDDLNFAADHAQMSAAELIGRFTASEYRVFMLGFLPGFAYMGEVDERIAMPRKATPRLSVAKGSVGIAGRQTGIYPLASPGGWQIIGTAELEIFTPENDPPCLLRPGDQVRFFSVS